MQRSSPLLMRVDHCIQIEEGVGIAQRLSVRLARTGIFTGRVQEYPDFDSEEPFILTIDWYALNFAGVLSQRQDCVERFFSCWGRNYSLHERHYSSAKVELLVLVKCMKKW